MKSLALSLILLSAPAAAQCDAKVDTCFRPGPVSCQDRIVAEINKARASLDVQAYNFTAVPIIQAIARAKARGVSVRALLDKENRQKRYTGATYLTNAGIEVRIDDSVSIAHNKVIVIDRNLVIGGSYNYTGSAENKNAENVTFTASPCVAEAFERNFESRWAVSKYD